MVPMVFGILNLIFGTIGLLGTCCCGVGLGFVYLGVREAIRQGQQKGAAPELQDFQGMLAAVSDNVPGIEAVAIGYLVATFILTLALLISGFGLIAIRPWGRWLCAVWAVLSIAVTVFGLGYMMFVFTPAAPKMAEDMEKWAKKIEDRARQKGQQVPPRQKLNEAARTTGNPILDNLSGIIFTGFELLYPAIAFMFMVIPQTGRAIARYHANDEQQGQPSPEHDLYYGDDERRRRPPEQPPQGY
jgi:hypothetical protein